MCLLLRSQQTLAVRCYGSGAIESVNTVHKRLRPLVVSFRTKIHIDVIDPYGEHWRSRSM